MVTDYHIDPSKRTVFLTFSGKVTFLEIADIIEKMKADAAFDPTFMELVDITGVDFPDLHFAELRHIARELDPFDPTARRAIIAPDGLSYGIARMYQMIIGNTETLRIVRSREEGLRWLDLEEG